MDKHKVTFRLPPGAGSLGEASVEVCEDLYPYGRHGTPGSLLDIALSHGVDIECACGGEGVCGTCHVLVAQGAENLSEADDGEMDVLDEVPGSGLASRLACRAVVHGDVAVTIPSRSRNAVREKG